MPSQTLQDACAQPKGEAVGRPTKENKRNQQLNLRLTRHELATLLWRAERAGMRLIDYGRWRVLGGEDQPVTPPTATPKAHHLVFGQLKRLGCNLNQMVRFCHATKRPPPAGLQPLLRDIRALINRGLGK
jgi:hypothetical protein